MAVTSVRASRFILRNGMFFRCITIVSHLTHSVSKNQDRKNTTFRAAEADNLGARFFDRQQGFCPRIGNPSAWQWLGGISNGYSVSEVSFKQKGDTRNEKEDFIRNGKK